MVLPIIKWMKYWTYSLSHSISHTQSVLMWGPQKASFLRTARFDTEGKFSSLAPWAYVPITQLAHFWNCADGMGIVTPLPGIVTQYWELELKLSIGSWNRNSVLVKPVGKTMIVLFFSDAGRICMQNIFTWLPWGQQLESAFWLAGGGFCLLSTDAPRPLEPIFLIQKSGFIIRIYQCSQFLHQPSTQSMIVWRSFSFSHTEKHWVICTTWASHI